MAQIMSSRQLRVAYHFTRLNQNHSRVTRDEFVIRKYSSLPARTQVVVCGAGMVGNSIAYHLTQAGWTDVVVLEQNQISSGTSHDGSGVLGLFKPASERKIVTHSVELIKQLQNLGYNLGFQQCGSLNLARTHDRAIALKRRVAYVKPSGLQCEWLDRHAIKALHPLLFTDDLEGGVWVPDDAVADPFAVSNTLASLAQDQGAKYVTNCRVYTVITDDEPHTQITPKVTHIQTNKGTVECEYFVNASGMWARKLGEQSLPKVRIPTFPAEHFYLHTLPMREAAVNLPLIRDYDSHMFCVTRDSKFIIGGFERKAKPAFDNGIPENWKSLLVGDEAHFRPIKKGAEHRLPILQNALYEKLINVPDNFTPDGKWILGETPEIDNYFVAVGMNGNNIQGAIGSGQAIAEWIIYGTPATQMLPFDVRRFIDLHNNRRYLKERTTEVVGRHYQILYPEQCEYRTARRLRCSPIYSELEAAGALFGTRMGFERALYFDKQRRKSQANDFMAENTFGKPHFHDLVHEEYNACREGVGIIDLSSFTKMEITSSSDSALARKFKSASNQVVEFMQKLCSNDVNIPVGGVVHTGMHNDQGGYENEGMLIRKFDNRYLMLAPTSQQTRIMDWMRRQITVDACVSVSDVTSKFSVLAVVGPKSRDLLTNLSNTDLSFYGNLAKEVNIAYASEVVVLNFTHMGEPGYTLIIPSEYTQHVYSKIMEVGHDYGIRNVGMKALRVMRVEKFIPFWAEEIDSTTTPYELGRGYRVKLDKEHFIGKSALLQQSHQGIKKRLVQFTVNSKDFNVDTDIWPWGGEPIYRNGKYVGNITSSTYGFTIGKMVCLGFVRHHEGKYVTPSYITDLSAAYTIDIAGRQVGVAASLTAPKIPVIKMDGFASYKPRTRGIVKA